MTVAEYLEIVKSENTYVTNSLILKSIDASGVVYKLLQKMGLTIAIRKEIFIATEAGAILEERVIIMAIEIIPAT